MRPLLLLPLLVLADGLGCRLALDAPPRPAVVHRRAAAPSFRRRSPSPLALFGLGADDKKTADAESDQRLLDALFGESAAETEVAEEETGRQALVVARRRREVGGSTGPKP